ncbi:MAG TPA: sugar nucleotide-binding protein [Pyrinomonadaceae bacterium]|nr:sugar nucleotide-binding protein [Pyrinomonadaceae bacterium]
MSKQRILVLGGEGMLGSMVADYFSRAPQFEVTATTRSRSSAPKIDELQWLDFDANAAAAPEAFASVDWVINCIGIIKPLIHDDNAAEVERATIINALFPHRLARWTEAKCRVLQIATDCVYSGTKGRYIEPDVHDPLDVYGKTKSIGEVHAPHVHHLRCSIIGPEAKSPKSLLEWFLGQSSNAAVNGFTNHRWNGVTTLHFAKLCAGIVKDKLELPHVQHVIPDGDLTKCVMLEQFARCFNRDDIRINPTEAGVIIDRTLGTKDELLNDRLWRAAGYESAPSVPQMIEELSKFNYRFNGRASEVGA